MLIKLIFQEFLFFSRFRLVDHWSHFLFLVLCFKHSLKSFTISSWIEYSIFRMKLSNFIWILFINISKKYCLNSKIWPNWFSMSKMDSSICYMIHFKWMFKKKKHENNLVFSLFARLLFYSIFYRWNMRNSWK